MKTASEWLQQHLGYRCQSAALFEEALTHRSATGVHNERLEFLGDAVLNCVIAMMLYRQFPTANEGDLSRLRASLVSGESLAGLAAELELGAWVRLGSGELKSGGFRRKSILADTLEAVFGAVSLDGGFDAATVVVERLFMPRLQRLPSVAELKDPKTRLQEALQSRGLTLPEYTVLSVSGAQHAQCFTVRCSIASAGIETSGEGGSRRAAEQGAAQAALDGLNALWNRPHE